MEIQKIRNTDRRKLDAVNIVVESVAISGFLFTYPPTCTYRQADYM
jgi:hypothetical protein